MGKDDEIGQLKPIACTVASCQQRFDTEKGMKRHKHYDPEHFYCRKCDVDCHDWDDLTLHKVYSMQPWLEGKRPQDEDDRPKHIVCEFCGEDFGSFGGRKLHRLQHHSANQNITCPGCKLTFVRAGELIHHLETGQCERITTQHFIGHVQQKMIHEQIWKAPETIQENLTRNQESRELAELCAAREVDQDTEDGGVDLLGYEEESQKLGIEPLEAQFETMHLHAFAESGPSGAGVTRSAKSFANDHNTGWDRVDKAYIRSYPTLKSTGTTPQTPPSPKIGAWSTGQTSQALFKDAKSTPPAGDWAAILNERKQAVEYSQGPSLLKCRFWDPNSADYDASRFYNHVTRQYNCPFEGCEEHSYDLTKELEDHIHLVHLDITYNCPLCGKRFKTGSALISHSESPGGKCRVKDSKLYGKLLDKASGGFLKAEHLRLPRVAAGEQLREGGGLMELKFTAVMPERAEMNVE